MSENDYSNEGDNERLDIDRKIRTVSDNSVSKYHNKRPPERNENRATSPLIPPSHNFISFKSEDGSGHPSQTSLNQIVMGKSSTDAEANSHKKNRYSVKFDEKIVERVEVIKKERDPEINVKMFPKQFKNIHTKEPVVVETYLTNEFDGTDLYNMALGSDHLQTENIDKDDPTDRALINSRTSSQATVDDKRIGKVDYNIFRD
jgi:hypothetical protein